MEKKSLSKRLKKLGASLVQGFKTKKAPEPEMPKPEEALELDMIQKTIPQTGITVKEAIKAMATITAAFNMAKAKRENTNTWRRMHGLPMRRRSLQERRRRNPDDWKCRKRDRSRRRKNSAL